MGTGWRRAFCNSVTDHDHGIEKMKLRCSNQHNHGQEEATSVDHTTSRGKLGFLSNPSTPRLRCRTGTTTDEKSGESAPTSAKHSPRVGQALLRALRLSRLACGICMAGVKTGQGTAVFTAECGHSFHFPCVAGHARNQTGCSLSCPVCSAPWHHAPLLPVPIVDDVETCSYNNIYVDDEPLMEESGEVKGFFVGADVEAELLQEVAVVDVGERDHRYVVAMRIKAPPARGRSARAAVDLVAVLDTGGSPSDTKLAMLKKAARLVVNSLGPADRLSLVFAGGRLLPLRRMTSHGRQAALKYVDELLPFAAVTNIPAILDRAANVLQHRRERNPVATVMLISNGVAPSSPEEKQLEQKKQQPPAAGTRFSHVEIPSDAGDFTKCVSGLLSVVLRDLQLHLTFPSGEISGIYSTTNPPPLVSGSGWIRLGDLYAEEERELLLELRLPAAVAGAHHVLTVKFTHRSSSAAPCRVQTLLVPRPRAGRPSERLRVAFVAASTAAEARRLAAGEDQDGALQIINATRAAILARGGAEAELSEFCSRRQYHYQHRRVYQNPATAVDDDGEPPTPTSAWRAADRMAKLAQTKKPANRVSDLHGFENARF